MVVKEVVSGLSAKGEGDFKFTQKRYKPDEFAKMLEDSRNIFYFCYKQKRDEQ
jgi:hypothetical protein